MKLHTIASVLALLTGSHSLYALDLTPQATFGVLEEVKIPLLTFADGQRRVTWQAPARWEFTGSGQKLTLYPREAGQSVMELQVHPREPKAATPGQTTEDLDRWVQQFLPTDALELQPAGQTTNPFTLGAIGSQEFAYTYLSDTRRFTTSIAVADLSSRERLVAIITAQTGNFSAIHQEAIGSMFRWTWNEQPLEPARRGSR